MNLPEEIKKAIDTTPNITKESGRALYVRVMRLIEQSRQTTGNRLGVTVMTPQASLAGDKVAQNRQAEQDIGDAKPKSL